MKSLRFLVRNLDCVIIFPFFFLFSLLALTPALFDKQSVNLDVDSTKYVLNSTILALSILLTLSFTQIACRNLRYPGFKKVGRAAELYYAFQATILFSFALFIGIWNISRFPTGVQENTFRSTEGELTLMFGALQFSLFALGLIRMILGLGVLKEQGETQQS